MDKKPSAMHVAKIERRHEGFPAHSLPDLLDALAKSRDPTRRF